ncbi:hypothetical protein N7508_009723 [Penicillium antarcticum]|uniref:uncharacterized protein n=1 Tax=Penicillium antarcticum TaxID=416450 RepID=UPI00238DB1D2|nr:uncharacterized protein N7508_009723 [Penicillium antarcticum]KAJ5294902.1 hypothetical protein N7508_009723 [Penicillium antarcticum]
MSDVEDAASSLSSCLSSGCDSEDLSDASFKLEAFQNRFSDLSTQCTSSDSSKGAANSNVPGLKAMFASGALLFGASMI